MRFSDAGIDTSIDGSEAKLMNEIVLTPTQPIGPSTGETDWNYEFHENHGRNVELERKTIARRVASYNQGKFGRFFTVSYYFHILNRQMVRATDPIFMLRSNR